MSIRSMTWYVRQGGVLVGTVIAESEESALQAASKKFQRYEFIPMTVEQKPQKRKR